MCACGPGGSVGIVTDYGLDGPGSNPGGGRDFPPVQTGLVPHPASCKMGTGSFQGIKCGQGVLLTTHPLLVPRSWKRPSGLGPDYCEGVDNVNDGPDKFLNWLGDFF